VETVGVEPTPPRCKRGALPPELHPQAIRTGGVEPPQPEAPGLQPGELTGAQRPLDTRFPVREARGGRPDSNRRLGDHDPGCLPLHHGHHGFLGFLARREAAAKLLPAKGSETGTTGIEPATFRLTSECSCRLSYAPKLRGWDSNPRSRAHEAREDGPSSTALGLAGRTRTCGLRFPKPAGCQAPLRPDETPGGIRTRTSGLRARCRRPSTTGARGSGGRDRTCASRVTVACLTDSTTPEQSTETAGLEPARRRTALRRSKALPSQLGHVSKAEGEGVEPPRP
jgi:hypothetical protein